MENFWMARKGLRGIRIAGEDPTTFENAHHRPAPDMGQTRTASPLSLPLADFFLIDMYKRIRNVTVSSINLDSTRVHSIRGPNQRDQLGLQEHTALGSTPLSELASWFSSQSKGSPNESSSLLYGQRLYQFC